MNPGTQLARNKNVEKTSKEVCTWQRICTYLADVPDNQLIRYTFVSRKHIKLYLTHFQLHSTLKTI